MKKIVISFITLMAALLILIGFCSCGTNKEYNCIEKTTTWQDANLKTDQNLYGICKAYGIAHWAQNNIIYTMGFYM